MKQLIVLLASLVLANLALAKSPNISCVGAASDESHFITLSGNLNVDNTVFYLQRYSNRELTDLIDKPLYLVTESIDSETKTFINFRGSALPQATIQYHLSLPKIAASSSVLEVIEADQTQVYSLDCVTDDQSNYFELYNDIIYIDDDNNFISQPVVIPSVDDLEKI